MNTLRYGVLLASTLLALASSSPAVGEETTTLCLAPVYAPERYVTIKIGYSKDVLPADFDASGHRYAGWFDAAKDRFWQLSVPGDFVIWNKRASDRAEVSVDVKFDLLYPEMLPLIEVQEEMQQLGIAKFGPFDNKAGLPGCERRGPLGIADLARKVTIDIKAPAACCRMPLEPEQRCTPDSKQETAELASPDISGLRACRRHSIGFAHVSYYGKLDDQPFVLTCPAAGGICVAGFDLWTWPVYVSFGNDRRDEWQNIVGAVRTFLSSATQSKSEIPGDIR